MICPKCGSNDHIIFKSRNDNNVIITEYFLCKCEYFANVNELKKDTFWSKIKNIFN